jgi:hypothetical protein
MLKKTGLSLCLCLAAAISSSVFASKDNPHPLRQAEARSVTTSPTELVEQGSYANQQGFEVHRPAHTVSGQAPAGATAQCRDRTYSFSMSRGGTCSRHGGVSRWL